MKKYRLEAIVFICGAAVMVLEMTGSRILAPYLGTSIFVWTSLIGIILASLSLGYWWGGKVSDQSPAFETFSRTIFAAGVSIGLMAVFAEGLLILTQSFVADVRLGAVTASLV